MSNLILPPSCRPVQMSSKEKVCVLVHHLTGRILCFCMDDPFASQFTDAGYLKIEINHASEYDLWAKRLRLQAKAENEAEDHAYLERENETRQKLRGQLKDRLRLLTDGPQRMAVESALHCMDLMEARKKRYRAESFMVQEGYDAGKADVGSEIVTKILENR